MKNNYEYLKIERQIQFLKKQVLASVRFRIQEKEKQKIHFTKAETNSQKV